MAKTNNYVSAYNSSVQNAVAANGTMCVHRIGESNDSIIRNQQWRLCVVSARIERQIMTSVVTVRTCPVELRWAPLCSSTRRTCSWR